MLTTTLSAADSPFVFQTPKAAAPVGPDPADVIVVPDAHLLFDGQFKRQGSDLQLSGDDGSSFLLIDYFKGENRAALFSPDGASLTGEVVDALAGPLSAGQFAQAAQAPGTAEVIGRVATVTGSASVVRNGVTIAVNPGDPVLKGDVLQTASGSTLGVTFADASTFTLTPGTRMVVNEFVYEQGGSANATLINLVQGAANFVAGQIAKTGDMKVGTPVATMGIRGTAVILEMSAVDGRVSVSVIDQRDNQTHAVEIFDRNGILIGRAISNGGSWVLTPSGSLQTLAQETGKSQQQIQQEFAAFQTLLNIYEIAKQYFPTPLPEHTNLNPRSIDGSGTQFTFNDLQLPKTADDTTVVVINYQTTNPGNGINNIPDLPPPPEEPQSVEVVINNPQYNFIYGTPDEDELEGTEGNDWVFGDDGDDTIAAGHGGGNDIYDGQDGIDTLKFESTTQGVTFDLRTTDGVQVGTASGAESGQDQFVNIEKVVGGSGNDLFRLHDDTEWALLDGGAGVDRIEIVGDTDFLHDDGPEVANIEIIDLNTTHANTVEFSGDGIAEMNAEGIVRILGGSDDQINLKDVCAQPGRWVLVAQDVQYTGDNETAGILFDKYEFVPFGGEQYFNSEQYSNSEYAPFATAYVQSGIEVEVENPSPTANDDVFVGAQNGWHLGENGHQYKFISDSLVSWQSARGMALAAAGYLATIGNEAENDLIFSLVGNRAAWLGGSDHGHEGQWSWTTEPNGPVDFGFENWAGGEPNNFLNEDYLVTWGNGWNDLADNFLARLVADLDGYVVERDGITEDGPAHMDASLLLANDSPQDGLSVSEVSALSAMGAKVTLNDDGTISYDASQAASLQALSTGETATDTFSYTVDDGNGGSATATVSVTVHGLNDAPSDAVFAAADDIEAAAGGTVLRTNSVIGSFSSTDAEGHELSYSLDQSFPARFTLSSDGVLRVGSRDVQGSSTFNLDIEAEDDLGASSSSGMKVWVGSSNGNTVSFANSDDPVIAFGLNGNDRITGSHHDDLFIGGGGNDQFVFKQDNGQDLICDFGQGDQIDLAAFHFSFEELQSKISTAGGDCMIDLGNGNNVTVQNVTSLTENDFILAHV